MLNGTFSNWKEIVKIIDSFYSVQSSLNDHIVNPKNPGLFGLELTLGGGVVFHPLLQLFCFWSYATQICYKDTLR